MLKNIIPDRNTFLHLRLPFSYFLLPVFLFALSQAEYISLYNALLVFVILHFFIYPGSNIYNSYMDKDEGSIGLLKNPPPVTRKLYTTSIVFDATGLLLCTLVSWQLTILMLCYTGISKAYSWHGIRLKKLPVTGWITVIVFQGAYTYMMVHSTVENNYSNWLTLKNILAMTITTLLIGGYYPLTQIYQHAEDLKRGDITISSKLGIKGTFLFTAIMFLIACIASWSYFNQFYNVSHFYIFLACIAPVIAYFLFWYSLVSKNSALADYSHAMKMTFLSSTCLNICYFILYMINHLH